MEEDRNERDPQEQEDHWVECSTDNGDTYFSNVITGETSWTKPCLNPEYPDHSDILTGGREETMAIHDEDANLEVAGALLEAPIAEDTTLNEVCEADLWLELYDEDRQVVYYFSPESGQVRWEPPLEPTAVVQHCDSDAVLKTVVSLQSAARSQQARARVAVIRQEKAKKQHPEISREGHVEVLHEEEAAMDDINSTTTDFIMTEVSVPDNDDSPWVEVYDPATQQQYYYSPRTSETSWAPPDTTGSSSEDRKKAAAISIQSLSRERLARKQVREIRAQLPEHQLSSRLEQEEAECEAIRRREMNHQELLQLSEGDRFWGLDHFEQELIKIRLEEEIVARTKVMNGLEASSPQQLTVVNVQLDFLAFEDEIMDTERLQREQQEEHDARLAMSTEEAQQCQNGDCFWGIQAEEANQRAANLAMAQEEAASNRFAVDVLQQALSATWEAEVQQNAAKELAARGGLEQRQQARYLRWFYHQCVSVDELLNFRWPVRQQQERLEEFSSPGKKRRHQVPQPNFNGVASATPYPLDDLIVRERLDHGDLRFGLRSILTVHHQSAQGTNGTRYEIVQAPPECAFDEATAAALLNSQLLPENSVEGGSLDGLERLDDRSLDGSQGSSVNYRRSRTPDPHIPARFNGVPYKPNQISPTREILSGDHRKLNQLPSLTKGKSCVDTSKIRHLQKAKTKARENVRTLSIPGQQLSNNRTHSESARERESDQDTEDTVELEDCPRAQFKRQEHEVLSKLFALMDLDASGTVNQNEMQWALQRDAEIHALAQTSPLLRLLLKQRTRLEALFTSHAVEELPVPSTNLGAPSESNNELTWDAFLARCEDAYLQLMSEGLILPDAVASSTPTENRAHVKESQANSRNKYNENENYPEPSAREAEAQTIRRVFSLLDIDGNGLLDVAEVQRTLYNTATATRRSAFRPDSTGMVSKELRALVEGSKALQPMLHQELFMTAFTKFEPMDPRGISEEEFVAFCLEIAHVAAANNMVVSVG
ncbi:hypothetical protein V7S43_018193 [Phytophthora oleae]|uniref:Calmodulin n=1 Tax=Phytophthora oleae TaxID=2107226 RepID=A0ABD3EQX4_9STRA